MSNSYSKSVQDIPSLPKDISFAQTFLEWLVSTGGGGRSKSQADQVLSRILLRASNEDFLYDGISNSLYQAGKAWYRLQSTALKLARMEHHYTFLKACCEENLIPHGLNFKTDVGLRLYPWILEKYSVGKHAFISHRIQELASDAYIIMTDLHAEFFFC